MRERNPSLKSLFGTPKKRSSKLEIICTAYQRSIPLTCQLWSFAAQTRLDFKVVVYHDGPNKEVEKAISIFKDSNDSFELEFRFTKTRHNDYGHSLREIGLLQSTSPFILLTNDDNYYTPPFVEEMLGPLERNEADVVYCDMVHSHKILDLPNPIGYQTLKTEPRLNRIDIGAFVFRAEIGKKVGFIDKSFAADGIFFESMLEVGANLKKIEKTLFVHN